MNYNKLHIGNDSPLDYFIDFGEVVTTLKNTRGLEHRERHTREALSTGVETRCPKWRKGEPEGWAQTSLFEVVALVRNPCSFLPKSVEATNNSLKKTWYQLFCGLSQWSRNYGVHPTARVEFAHTSPGDSYKLPFIDREFCYDDGD